MFYNDKKVVCHLNFKLLNSNPAKSNTIGLKWKWKFGCRQFNSILFCRWRWGGPFFMSAHLQCRARSWRWRGGGAVTCPSSSGWR